MILWRDQPVFAKRWRFRGSSRRGAVEIINRAMKEPTKPKAILLSKTVAIALQSLVAQKFMRPDGTTFYGNTSYYGLPFNSKLRYGYRRQPALYIAIDPTFEGLEITW